MENPFFGSHSIFLDLISTELGYWKRAGRQEAGETFCFSSDHRGDQPKLLCFVDWVGIWPFRVVGDLILHISQAASTHTKKSPPCGTAVFEILNLDIITGALDSAAPVVSDLRQDSVLPIASPISLLSILEIIMPILREVCRVISLEALRTKLASPHATCMYHVSFWDLTVL